MTLAEMQDSSDGGFEIMAVINANPISHDRVLGGDLCLRVDQNAVDLNRERYYESE
jgi:hypothetical protein